MMRAGLTIALTGLLLLPGCGRGEDTPGQPSADQRQKLDDIARKRDEEQSMFDTSPDSLVPAEEAPGAGNGASAPQQAAPAPGNVSSNVAR